MDNLQTELTEIILKFRSLRNWEKFHKGKDIAMCLSIEANEALELFLWKEETEVDTDKLKDEIGDILYSLLLLANHFKIDLKKSFLDKMKKNELKYPIDKFYDSNKKYDELD